METIFVQGRWLTADELDWIRQLIGHHPEWGRYRLSLHLAEQWNWRNGIGRIKDMAGGGSRPAKAPLYHQAPLLREPLVEGPLEQLLPINLMSIDTAEQRQLLGRLLSEHHYLGYKRPVGENLQYLARDRSARPLACLVFGAAAWKCAPRDQFIGWSGPQRESNLHLLANQMRFLILPWVQVKHLASHLLGLAARRLSADWQAKYGHPIYLLETFVQRDRFQGGCYRAANWVCAGQTQSRSRNDGQRCLRVACKDVYLYALSRHFRSRLQTQGQQSGCGPKDSSHPLDSPTQHLSPSPLTQPAELKL